MESAVESPHATHLGLLSMPPEILDNIASHAAVSDASFGSSSTSVPSSFLYDPCLKPSQVVTPPTDLFALQLVCRRLWSLLNIDANPRLHARVFRSKFDIAALVRTIGIVRELQKERQQD